MTRPGFTYDVDGTTPPVLVAHGDGFRLVDLPAGSRIVYPPEGRRAIVDVDGAVRRALGEPTAGEPLAALLAGASTLTVVVDDRQLPRGFDPRPAVVEAVLDLAADASLDDVAVVVGSGLRRRPTDAELRAIVGSRVHGALAPESLVASHDAEAPGMVVVGTTPDGIRVEVAPRIAASDVVVVVGLVETASEPCSLIAAVGSTATILALHPPDGARPDPAVFDAVVGRAGPVLFHVELTVERDAVPTALHRLGRREWEWNVRERVGAELGSRALAALPARIRRRALRALPSATRVTAVVAGDPAACAVATGSALRSHQSVTVDGPADMVLLGLPDGGLRSVEPLVDPVQAMHLGLGRYARLHTGQPLVRDGGVVLLSHPMPMAFDPARHPATLDFFDQVLPETLDPLEMAATWEKGVVEDEWYRHLYRNGHAAHAVEPFHAWYDAAATIARIGRVIVVGGDPMAVHGLGFRAASTLRDALEMAEDIVGIDASLTHLHVPPLAVVDVV